MKKPDRRVMHWIVVLVSLLAMLAFFVIGARLDRPLWGLGCLAAIYVAVRTWADI